MNRRDFLASTSALAINAATPVIPMLALSPRPAAAAVDEAALVSAAKKEGKGTLYTVTVPEPTENLLKAFTKKYGIEIDIQKLTGAALAQRFTAEYDSNINLADLFVSSDPVFPTDAMKKGWLSPADDLPALKDWPKAGYQGGLVSVAFYPYVLAWNTTLVPGGLKSFEELNDPKWHGKVLVGDPRVLASARLWYVAVMEKFGENFLRDLGKHATYSPSVVPGLQQLAAGSQGIYAPAVHLSVVSIMEKGAPINYSLPEPITVSRPVAGIAAKAPHPNVARLLLNFWMTKEGQEVYAKGGYTLLPNVPGTKLLSGFTDMDADAGEKQLSKINSLLGIG
jgi:iron(III) transport system substrate-binding protein